MFVLDPKKLLSLNKPAPRYTSYPTAPEWTILTPEIYASKLQSLDATNSPLSLYFHIPFCRSMCLYCACSVILNRRPENEALYVNYLIKEIELVASFFKSKRYVTQLHFGGGTPTQLSIPLFTRLFEAITSTFEIDFSQEVAIEIDPRTVIEDNGEKLKVLKKLGFNRVSFGVQDTDPKVQEAIKRRQSYEMTKDTFDLARKLEFKGINIDLIYGLPFQTPETFRQTISHLLGLYPDRIALFSYAKVPWLKPHQKAMKEETLPSIEQKFEIYAEARERLIKNGYVAIGMDHFAQENDEIALCYKEKKLQRNFQGYSARKADEALSFGITSIGLVQNTYVQNLKELPSYYASLDQGILPVHRGCILSSEDILRKWVIHTLMCDFELDKTVFYDRFGVDFDVHFQNASGPLLQLETDGFIVNGIDKLAVTPLGELFIRVVAMTFDAYLQKSSLQPKFSQSI